MSKPPLILDPPNRTPYTCAVCGQSGLGTPNQKTCSERCLRAWRRQKAAAKRDRDAARLRAGRVVL